MPLASQTSEIVLRLGVFVVVFAVMALLERTMPKRPLVAPKARRWTTNLAIVLIDSAIVRAMAALSLPLAAIAAAVHAESRGWGLLNIVSLPGWLEVLIALIALDFAIWLQHLMAHRITILWRLHRMHHADRDFDVTTAIRFHPIEIALSMLYKIAWIFLLGASPLSVLLFEVILNGCALFNHANVALPVGLDRVLRLVVVTPDMHRVHHSVLDREHNSNFGFNLSIWDRMLGTYTPQPERGHEGMTIGLSAYQHDGPTRLGWSLRLPWRRER